MLTWSDIPWRFRGEICFCTFWLHRKNLRFFTRDEKRYVEKSEIFPTLNPKLYITPAPQDIDRRYQQYLHGERNSIFGFFASFGMNDPNKELVKSILWGTEGIDFALKPLKYSDYGTDFKIILFQVYSNPISYERDSLKPLENYRRKEKSIGIPIILDDDNFFKLDNQQQRKFLMQTVIEKLNLLNGRVKKSKLDINIPTLIEEVKSKLNNW